LAFRNLDTTNLLHPSLRFKEEREAIFGRDLPGGQGRMKTLQYAKHRGASRGEIVPTSRDGEAQTHLKSSALDLRVEMGKERKLQSHLGSEFRDEPTCPSEVLIRRDEGGKSSFRT